MRKINSGRFLLFIYSLFKIEAERNQGRHLVANILELLSFKTLIWSFVQGYSSLSIDLSSVFINETAFYLGN